MANGTVTFTVNGVDKTHTLKLGGTWNLTKRMAQEAFNATTFAQAYTSLADVPSNGDAVLLYHNADLIFGGQVRKIRRYRMGGDGPTAVDIICRGWELLAEQSTMTRVIASGPLLTQAYALFLYYLQPKGVTWLGPTSGGPTIPEMVVTKANLADVYTRMQKLTNWMWRINGLKQLGFVDPGTLPFPKDPLLGTDFELGVSIESDYFERATRLILTTGGDGEAIHSETHIGNGSKTYFLLNVEPKPDETDEAMVTTSFIPTEVVVNGVTNAIGGGVWSYDTLNHAVYKSGAAVPNTHTVVVSYKIGFPATVRVWEPSLLLSTGHLDWQFVVDKQLQIGHITDVAEARAWGDVELLNRGGSPRTIKGKTAFPGWYPLLTGTVQIPSDNVNASFLVQGVTIKDTDRAGRNNPNHLLYELDLIEGDTPGRNYESLFREMLAGGVSGGGGISVAGSGGTVITPGTGGTGIAELAGTYPLHSNRDVGAYGTSGSRVALGTTVWLNGDKVPAGATVQFRVMRKTDNASTSVTAVLRRLTGTATDVATATTITSTTFVESLFSFTPISGWHSYELQVYGSDANNAVYAVAAVDVLPA